MKNTPIKFGIIGGACIAILHFVFLKTGISNEIISSVLFVMAIGLGVIVGKAVKRENNNKISFGNVFSAMALASLIFWILSTASNIILMETHEDYKAEILKTTINQVVSEAEGNNTPDDQIEMLVSVAEFFFTIPGQILGSLLLLISFILLDLIIAAFIRTPAHKMNTFIDPSTLD